ncbi:MAG: polyribonucleotide nucleotidyltransferase [Candidatus Omnitrophica bacterium]|nr:polyribonucleotide nucleotidyltransferase [Candidatus Omnitrophota bacterium]
MAQAHLTIPFGSSKLIIESGQLAKQANGAVTVTVGGTVVLVTACMASKPKEGQDFFPLTVEYQEKTYSAGKIPGGFFKREGRPTEREVLACRLIDRPIRPLFPEGFLNEVQVVATVLSHDGENDPDILAIIGASAALTISDIPYDGPVGAVRVGLIDGQCVANPTFAQREKSIMDLVVVGWGDGIVMIEGEANEVGEDQVLKGLGFALQALEPSKNIQLELKNKIGKQKTKVELKQPNADFIKKIREMALPRLNEIYTTIADKGNREEALNSLCDQLTTDMDAYAAFEKDGHAISEQGVRDAFESLQYEIIRGNVFTRKLRADGRGLKDIRPIECAVGILPRTHGSSLFTRGQTQSLGIITLGTKDDEQLVEALEGTSYKTFMLHYNFPAFSVGETKPMRSPGRREIGHGALAAKALKAVLPTKDEFPYTVRVVSEILESNGSSSMASVCSGCLALMDAGVPVKAMVAGISVGLISDEKNAVLITDIMGLEDYFGDMDFKVAGSRKGVTAIQLDLKIKKLSMSLLEKAVAQAKEARLIILDKMEATLSQPRSEMSPYAPRIVTIQIPQDKIGEVIGPGGKIIRRMIEESGVTSIDIEEDGKVIVASPDQGALDKAVAMIRGLTEEPEVGKIYDAVVKRIMNFGVFVEFLPGREGLVHVSELASKFVKDVNEVAKLGDKFKVKLVEKDEMGRFNLSKKQAESKV